MNLPGTEILFLSKAVFVNGDYVRTLPVIDIVNPEFLDVGHQNIQFSIVDL